MPYRLLTVDGKRAVPGTLTPGCHIPRETPYSAAGGGVAAWVLSWRSTLCKTCSALVRR